MHDVVRVIYLDGDVSGEASALDSLRGALTELPCAGCMVAATLPGARNGGDVIVRLRFGSADEWQQHRADLDAALRGPGVGHVVGAAYPLDESEPSWRGRREEAGGPGVYRALLLKVADDAADDDIARFERALLQMPAHVPQIRAWRLSRVEETEGSTRWTHLWEQEYGHVDDLLGAYMNHPIHWAYVDQWFDPESPLRIVRERVCHTFCAIDSPVLTAHS